MMRREKLIEYRGNRTQEYMAKKYNVTQQAWDSWEKGKRNPKVSIMKRIEVDSGISMERIFFDIFDNNVLSTVNAG